jgi:uncharacterized Zn-finger protein
MSKETSSKNEPINERSSQSGTQGSQRSGQNPMPTGTSPQNKCEVCGKTFSNQSELNGHYKTIHNKEAPTQQSQSENKTQNQHKCQRDGQTFSNQNDLNEHNKKVHNIEPDKMGKEAGSVNKGNETSSTQSGERDIGSQKPMQNQYKCQRCNQLLANQNDLNEHNKKVHNIEPDKMGKEPEAKKSTPT